MIYKTAKEAEEASNKMYLQLNPEGTTELLYGWVEVEGGYKLSGASEDSSSIEK